MSCSKTASLSTNVHNRDSLSILYYDSATRLMQGSDIEQHLLDKSIELNPRNAKAWFEKSAWAIKAGNYLQYLNYMGKACELDPQSYLGWRGAVKLYYFRDYEGAIIDLHNHQALFRNAVTSPRGENVYFLIGQAKKQSGDLSGAIEAFDKYISYISSESGPEWVDVYCYLYRGNIFREMGNLKESLVEYDKAIGLFSNCSEAYFFMALSFFELGEAQRACHAIDKAIENSTYLRKDPYREVFDEVTQDEIFELRRLNCKGHE